MSKATVTQQKLETKLGFEVLRISTDISLTYAIDFTSDLFTKSINRFKLIVPHNVHDLGSRYSVIELSRNGEDFKGNVWFQHRTLVNGDLEIIADEAFDGTLVIKMVRRK